jgi:hypothetical protein
MFQVDSKFLNVETTAERDDIVAQAETIASAIVEAGTEVNVCMMHTPLPEQLADLEKVGAPVVLVGGQMMLMYHLIPLLLKKGYIVVEAVTQRVAVETALPDGSVVKKSVFKYERMRSY